MLKPDLEPSPPLSDRELGLIAQLRTLRGALQTTIDFIESGVQPVLPPHIERFRSLLSDSPEDDSEAVSARELFDVVTAMVRFLSQTSSADLFARHGRSGLADWTILMTLVFEPPNLTDRQLTRIMGSNYRRIQRLTETLAQAGLVKLTPFGEKGRCLVEITPAGHARLAETNAALEPMLKWFTQRHRFRLMFAARHARMLTRMYDGRPAKK